jgi:hypothetical protein
MLNVARRGAPKRFLENPESMGFADRPPIRKAPNSSAILNGFS